MSEKICQHCNKSKKYFPVKNTCGRCYKFLKIYGTISPQHLNRKCESCENDFDIKTNNQKFCSNKCYRKVLVHKKWIEYRIENNIDLSIQKKIKAPNGMGHKEPHGYIYINKMRHPNAQKRGRIYEHTYVMSQYLGRPIKKGESVHHKNGIRDDNRIENLELWSKSQPAGQRVEDKIKWAKEFLEEYGYLVTKLEIKSNRI